MTDKEIIKVLECCADESSEKCDECPYSIDTLCCKIKEFRKDSLDLINRQQERLEAAIAGQEILQKALAEKDREIELLTAEKEIERLKKLLEEEEAKYKECAKRFYKEGIKQFAERLKQRCSANSDINYYILKKLVDNLVKEMIGE